MIQPNAQNHTAARLSHMAMMSKGDHSASPYTMTLALAPRIPHTETNRPQIGIAGNCRMKREFALRISRPATNLHPLRAITLGVPREVGGVACEGCPVPTNGRERQEPGAGIVLARNSGLLLE